MLHRRTSHNQPIDIDLSTHDILLTACICEFGVFPNTYAYKLNMLLKPTDFATYDDFADYMGIVGVTLGEHTDYADEFTNDFLNFFGICIASASSESSEPAVDADWTQEERDERDERERLDALDALAEAELEELRFDQFTLGDIYDGDF